ncbi:hypothetical protein ACSYAY_06670 [Leptospirillum ferriphilum]|jgi:hypothetical protein|uniref:hypothetical protein n=1 Tax=Leptospirillum ferriphilum TaxID=178606 RepID=UPI003EE49BCD
MSEATKILRNSEKKKPPAAGKGRPRGAQNKITRALREAVLKAFDEVGGEAWLVEVARTDPRTFVSLLGRLLPNEVKAEVQSGPMQIVIGSGDLLLPVGDTGEDIIRLPES